MTMNPGGVPPGFILYIFPLDIQYDCGRYHLLHIELDDVRDIVLHLPGQVIGNPHVLGVYHRIPPQFVGSVTAAHLPDAGRHVERGR